MKSNSLTNHGVRIKSLLWVFFFTVVSASFLSSIQPEEFFFGNPLYLGFERTMSYKFVVCLFLAATLAISLLPIPFLGGARKYLMISAGMYLALGHLLAPVHDRPFFLLLSWFANPAAVIFSGLAAFLSINEKFEALFLSISGGYVLSVVIFRVFRLTGGILYLITLLVFVVILQIIKKPFQHIHVGICKAAILTYSGYVIIDFIPTIFLLESIFKSDGLMNKLQTWIFYLTFPIVFAVLFFMIAFKKLIST